MRSLTASDRSSLIRLASSLPTGSEERRAIIAGLATAQIQNEVADKSAQDKTALPALLSTVGRIRDLIDSYLGAGGNGPELASHLRSMAKEAMRG